MKVWRSRRKASRNITGNRPTGTPLQRRLKRRRFEGGKKGFGTGDNRGERRNCASAIIWWIVTPLQGWEDLRGCPWASARDARFSPGFNIAGFQPCVYVSRVDRSASLF